MAGERPASAMEKDPMTAAQKSDTTRNLIAFLAAVPLAGAVLTAIYASVGVFG